MSSTYSPSLRAELIGAGDQSGTWGTTTNSNFQYIFEAAIAGVVLVPIAPTANNQVLTYVNGPTSTSAADQSVYAVLKLNASAVSANFSIYAPPASKTYIVWNNTSYTATFYNSSVIGNTTAAGSGITIPAGAKAQIWSDATNFWGIDATIGSLTVTGTVTAASFSGAGTGLTGTAAGLSIGGNAATATTAANGGVTSATAVAGTGISVTSVTTTGAATHTINNTGITSVVAGTAISVSTTSGAATVNNTGVTSIVAGTGISISGATGAVTVTNTATSLPGVLGQVFTSSGTFTIPTGVTALKVTVVGGGGGGGGARTACSNTAGSGAGGGALSVQYFTGLTPANTLSVTVGVAGSAGTSGGAPTNGGAGGASSIASGTQTITTASANGGGAGIAATASNATTFGAGGAASSSGVAYSLAGYPGTIPFGIPCIGNGGGNGGNTAQLWGNGAISYPALADNGYGSGGCGGGFQPSLTNALAGKAGIVIVEW